MADCPHCGKPLNESLYIRNNEYKSCPRCSVELNRHAFYPLDYFGDRHHEDGTPFIQSYCKVCRGHSDRIGNPLVFC